MVAPSNDRPENALKALVVIGPYVSPAINQNEARGEATGWILEQDPIDPAYANSIEPNIYGRNYSIWWVYRPAFSGVASFDTLLSPGDSGGGNDTELFVFRHRGGTVVRAMQLTGVGGTYVEGFGYRNSVNNVTVTAGETYYIQLGRYSAETENSAHPWVVLRATGPEVGAAEYLTLTQTGATADTVTASFSSEAIFDGFQLRVAGAVVAELAGSDTSAIITGLAPSNSYIVELAPYRIVTGSGPSYMPVALTATSSVYGSPENAFDNNFDTYWGAPVGNSLTADLGQLRLLDKYAIGRQNVYPGSNAKNWTLSGSVDGVSFTTIDTQTDQFFSNNEPRDYELSTSTPYRYYRYTVTAANADSNFGTGTLRLYGFGVDPHREYTQTTITATMATMSGGGGGGGGGGDVDNFRAVVSIGSHTWDVDAGDPPALGPILPLGFGWSVPEDSLGFPAQPDPELCPMEVVTATYADMAGVDIGTPMRVSLYRSNAPGARPLATFRGRVADLEAAPHPRGLSWRLLGVGYTADLGPRQVGSGDWPQESGDARAARIVTEAGYPGWSSDPIGTTFEARGPGVVSARAELEASLSAAVTAEGNAYGPAVRVLVHPNTDATGALVTDAPFAGSAVVRRVDALDFVSAGLINRNTSWRRTKLLDATWVTIDHPGGPTTYGDTRGPAYPALSVPITDPRELADLILDTTPGYRWLTEAFRLELWATDDPLAVDWFYRDADSSPFPWSGRAVIVEGIAQAPDGSTRYAGMLAGARLVLEPGGRMVVEFRLRPEVPADSTVTMRWMDEPPTATWAEELAADPTGTWFDYRLTPRP